MTEASSRSKSAASRAASSGSLLTLDCAIAVALCVAHAMFCWSVYETYTSPLELQKLSWWLPAAASVAYGLMIFLGRKIMASRSPISPRNAMLVYNVYQSLINGFMSVWLVTQAAKAGFSVWGNYEDRSVKGFPIAFGMWMHYNNKYLELFDTFFMVIKKKDEQISFLHVYHHILLVWSWFLCILFCIGGDAYFGASFNSLVHFFMYAYYAMALFAIPCPWKKHLTMFQMIQFVFCASQSVYVFFKGNVWWFVPALQLFVMVQMLYLFNKFYQKKYNGKGAKGSKDAKSAKSAAAGSSAKFAFENHAIVSSSTSPAESPTFSTALVRDPQPASPVSPAEEEAASPASGSSDSPKQREVEDGEVVMVEQPKKAASAKKRSKKAD